MDFSEFDSMDWKTAEAEKFATYWRSLSSPGTIAHKSNFDPASIPSLLPNISIYEIRENGDVYCRLMGTGLAERFGHDYTGESILSWWGEMGLEGLLRTFKTMSDQPCGVLTQTKAHTKTGLTFLNHSVGFPALNANDEALLFVFYTTSVVSLERHYPKEDKVHLVEVLDQTMVSLD
ncbi:MAG: PAS domain-containing protein [Sneathiella sp.]